MVARVTASCAKLFEITSIPLSGLQALYLLLSDVEKKKKKSFFVRGGFLQSK